MLLPCLQQTVNAGLSRLRRADQRFSIAGGYAAQHVRVHPTHDLGEVVDFFSASATCAKAMSRVLPCCAVLWRPVLPQGLG